MASRSSFQRADYLRPCGPFAAAARAVDAAELAIMERDDEAAQMAYAQALSDWGDAGGYEAETLWDMCTMAALGVPFDRSDRCSSLESSSAAPAPFANRIRRTETTPGISARCGNPSDTRGNCGKYLTSKSK